MSSLPHESDNSAPHYPSVAGPPGQTRKNPPRRYTASKRSYSATYGRPVALAAGALGGDGGAAGRWGATGAELVAAMAELVAAKAAKAAAKLPSTKLGDLLQQITATALQQHCYSSSSPRRTSAACSPLAPPPAEARASDDQAWQDAPQTQRHFGTSLVLLVLVLARHTA